MMKMKVVVLTLLFLLGSQLGGLALNHKAQAEGVSPGYSTWLWDTSKIVNGREATLQFLEAKQVSHVFLQIDRSIDVTYYHTFIREAAKLGMDVYALDGAPNWGANNKAFLNFINWVSGYQNGAAAGEKFAGIHLDIEPYLTEQWTTNYGAAVLKYQGAILAAANTASALDISLAVDIPFWFDEMNFRNKHGKGNLAEWAMKNTDEVTIMAYRDKAVGPNGIIELVKYEMNLAASLNKDVTIAVETMNLGSSDGFLTFFEEGQAEMNNQLGLVLEQYQGYSSFGGFAVHHVGSWMELE
ncbi:amidase [Metabacillus endolithicus]|uniref:Amidase n=2 Tax=Metabacillus endolithicus TaxID=1535204 RepID=A0ABW5BY37_9BACI|nr:amidase [Metabacillus endolithicus]UPG65618.1 amidase [Metabacillus endolithicus]